MENYIFFILLTVLVILFCVFMKNFMKSDCEEIKEFDELKICPFCGGNAKVYTYPWFREVHISCTKCGIKTIDYKSKHTSDSIIMAIHAWNRRNNEE